MRYHSKFSAFICILLVTACTTAPKKAPPVPVVQAPKPAPPAQAPIAPRSSDWMDWDFTPGDWSYQQDSQKSIAIFGRASTAFRIVCAPATRQIMIGRSGQLASGKSERLLIRGTAGKYSYSLHNAEDGSPFMETKLAGNDPALDQMVYSRGRLLIRVEGTEDLVVPTYAEIARVVEDCRG